MQAPDEQSSLGGFADGRSEASPDSEWIEATVAMPHKRNSTSVEQIQDRSRATRIVKQSESRQIVITPFFTHKYNVSVYDRIFH